MMSDESAKSDREGELRAGIRRAEQARDWPAVDAIYRELRKSVDEDAEMVAAHGRVVFTAGDPARAATITRRALRLEPGNTGIMRQLADIYFDQERLDEAERIYREVLELTPGDNEAMRRLSQILQKRDHGSKEAEELLKKVTEADPDDVKALMLLGALYANDKTRYKEAEPVFERVLELTPDAPSALHNYGLLKRFQGDLDTAIKYLRKACEVYPNASDFAFSLGTCYLYMHDVENALKWFNRATELDPKNNAAQVYTAYALFHLGRMREGWEQYETRLDLEVLKYAKIERPRWQGEDLDGKTLLLTPEQGMGDNLQFIRYAKLAVARGATVIVATNPPLERLFQCLEGVSQVTTSVPAPWHFHRYSPLLSMPYVLATDSDTIPADVPYLSAPEETRNTWRERLHEYPGLRVGICWRGNPRHVNDTFRSSSLAEMSCLLSIPGATFFSLHKERPDDEQQLPEGLIDIGTEFEDFADTAAAMECLDLVVSVDTSICHLAGAVGRPVWTMLARGPDFRWGLEGESTPWYPTMKLYRQKVFGDWSDVFERLKANLTELIKSES